MKYKLTSVLFFSSQTNLTRARNLLLEVWDRSESINVGTPSAEHSFYELERCFHDEPEPRPCVLIQRRVKDLP